MSVRVNLLPKVSKQAQSATRMRGLTIGLSVLVLVGLGVASLLQVMARSDARDELADAQRERALAQSEVDDLAIFAGLERDIEEAEAVLQATLGRQASLAGVLQDIALTMPEDVAITGLNINLSEAALIGPGVGVLTASAETVSGIAPGAERYLLILDQLAGFDGVYLTSASTDTDGVTTFQVDLILGEEYLTRRFGDGGSDAEVTP